MGSRCSWQRAGVGSVVDLSCWDLWYPVERFDYHGGNICSCRVVVNHIRVQLIIHINSSLKEKEEFWKNFCQFRCISHNHENGINFFKNM